MARQLAHYGPVFSLLVGCYSPNNRVSGGDTTTGDLASSSGDASSVGEVESDTSTSGVEGSSSEPEGSSADTGTSSADTETEIRCGDGQVDGDEVCDDGTNDGSYGTCGPGCGALGPRCGDNVVQAVEQCDDGNAADADGCNTNCVVSGSEIWTRVFSPEPGGTDHLCNAVTAGLEGDIIAVGGEQTPSIYVAWMRRLDADGNTVWLETYAANDSFLTYAFAVDVDGQGNMYVGGGAYYPGGGDPEGWFRSYDLDASLGYSHDPGVIAQGVGASVDGNVAFVAPSQTDGVVRVRRLSALGATLWTDDVDVPGEEATNIRVAVDSDENIVVIANASGQIWIRKFSPEGAVQWTRTIANAEGTDVGGIAIADNNEIAVSGRIGSDGLIRLYDQDGGEQWSVTESFGQASRFADVDFDSTGRVVAVASGFDGSSVHKLSGAGAALWTVDIPDFTGQHVAADTADGIVVVGTPIGGGNETWFRKFSP